MQSREAYVSYPPGAVIPIYLLSWTLRREPTVAIIMGWNLANHFLIALLLGLTVYFALSNAGMSPLNALAFSVSAPCLELLFPAPFYFLQSVYGMDTAVLLPFAAVVFLETLRASTPKGKLLTAIDSLQWCAFFFGYLTDWLMVFVGVTVYAKRLVLGEVPRSSLSAFLKAGVAFWSSAWVAGALFVAQVTWLAGWKTLLARFLIRSGIDREHSDFPPQTVFNYFYHFIPDAFGPCAQWVLLGRIVFFLGLWARAAVRRFRGVSDGPAIASLLAVMGLAILPCLIQLRVFWQHSGHSFSAVKFSVPCH